MVVRVDPATKTCDQNATGFFALESGKSYVVRICYQNQYFYCWYYSAMVKPYSEAFDDTFLSLEYWYGEKQKTKGFWIQQFTRGVKYAKRYFCTELLF